MFGSKRKNRRKIRTAVIAAALTVVFFAWLCNLYSKAAPTALMYAEKTAKAELEKIICDEVLKCVSGGNYNYDKITSPVYDTNGNIVSVNVNATLITSLRAEVIEKIYKRIDSSPTVKIKVPSGNILSPKYLSGRGFGLGYRAVMYPVITAAITSSLTASGINQTLHTITIEVTVDMSLLCMSKNCDYTQNSEIIVAQSVIVGNIPAGFYNY